MRRVRSIVAVLTALFRTDGDVLATLELLLETNRLLLSRLDRAPRLTNDERRRLASLAHGIPRRLLETYSVLATPDTLLRWYRTLVAEKYTAPPPGLGRPPLKPKTKTTLLRLARENPSWGYDRIAGELRKLDLEVSASTVRRVLESAGVPPAPERRGRRTWAEFMRTQAANLAAMDFFSVEALTPPGIVRYLVCFVVDVGSREVKIAGIRRDPDGAWVEQIARSLTDPEEGFLVGKRYLVMDRDPLYTEKVQAIFRSGGVMSVRIPARSPNLNAHAERFVRSVREECLNHLIILGERHLRRTLDDYLAHYNTERPHQGIGNQRVRPPPDTKRAANDELGRGGLVRRSRLGGLLNSYTRTA
jgi:transposase InsO family protein